VLAPRQPVRVVVDGRGRTPAHSAIFAQPGITIVATTRESSPAWRTSITEAGGTILECEPADPGVNMNQLMRVLAARGILSAWVEGGPQVLGSLFDEGLVNETWAFIAPKILGGEARAAIGGAGVSFVADAHQLREIHVEQIGEDVLVRGYVGEWEPR
jgi:diaminohydroxyphosphoribosylaminopyrimidine deaminase/5-amino-6-(5-phosphoribosylamino)uracil reductase